jgi:hypothetical protein
MSDAVSVTLICVFVPPLVLVILVCLMFIGAAIKEKP